MNIEQLRSALAEAAVANGVTEYEMYYAYSSDTDVSGLNGELNSFSVGTSAGICLRVLKDGRMGYASSELFDAGEMRELVVRALENAENTEKLDEIGLFAGSPSYEAPRMKPYAPIDTPELKKLTLDMMSALYSSSDKVGPGTSASAVSGIMTHGLVNSHGLALESTSGINVIVAESVVTDGGETQADYVVRPYDEGSSLDEIAREATDGALSKIGAGLVPSGKYDVVIAGPQMRSILSAFSPAFSAKNAQMGLSLLEGKVGTRVASDIVNIIDEPMREGSSVGTPFDAEGVATHRKEVIAGGVLKTFLHNRETAARAGVATTANASKASYSSPVGISPYCFYFDGGSYTDDGLLALVGDGILVTEVKGLHAGTDAVTGDFSIESAGYMIRDGKRAEAVKSFTIAGNFFTLLSDIAALGKEVKFATSGGISYFGSPDVLVKGISVAGK